MEDYEKFKMNKSNVIMLVITSILFIILLVVSVMLGISLKKPNQGLPSLNITQGRYTTRSTTAGTGTTTTTTTKVRRESSPYYEVDVDSLLNDEIYKKRELSREEALKVGQGLFEVVNPLYDFTDNSLFDTEAVVNSVKEGEKDIVENKGHKYAELYNFDAYVDKFFTRQTKNMLLNYKYQDVRVFYRDEDKTYRLVNTYGKANIVIVDYELVENGNYTIKYKVRYYNSNYKDMGYSAPNYSFVTVELGFEERWKVRSYKSPLYD